MPFQSEDRSFSFDADGTKIPLDFVLPIIQHMQIGDGTLPKISNNFNYFARLYGICLKCIAIRKFDARRPDANLLGGPWFLVERVFGFQQDIDIDDQGIADRMP